jgi:transposase-like protein
LVVLDGGKALAKAVGEVFGVHAVVQRCRVHKTRNVLDHLPKPMQAKFAWRLKTAW